MASKDPINKMWQEFALRAAQEKNPDRLLEYVNELNAALDKQQISARRGKRGSEPQPTRKTA